MKSFRDDLIDRMKSGGGRFVLASVNPPPFHHFLNCVHPGFLLVFLFFALYLKFTLFTPPLNCYLQNETEKIIGQKSKVKLQQKKTWRPCPQTTSKTEASRTMGINSTTSAITAPVSSPETGFLRHKKWWNSKTKTSIVDVVQVYSYKAFTISPIIGSKSQQAAIFRFVDLHCLE
jgi:hypothetical protein